MFETFEIICLRRQDSDLGRVRIDEVDYEVNTYTIGCKEADVKIDFLHLMVNVFTS